MVKIRKTKKIGGSINIVIPSELAKEHNIEDGEIMEFQQLEQGVISMKKTSDALTCTIKNKETGKIKKIPKTDGKCIIPKGWEKV